MEVVCSYCEKKLGTKPPVENKMVSHGICQPCFEEMIKRHKIKRAEADSKLIRQ